MAFPTIFANLAAGLQPAALLDQMFNICGAMGNIPCNAVGTNTIVLTPVTNFFQPAAYANYQMVTFRAVATSTGAVSIQLGTLPVVKLYMPSGLQAGAGDITAGNKVIAVFAADLDGGNGGFIVFNATTPSVVQGVQGAHKGLVAFNSTGSPDTQWQIQAQQLVAENAGGGTVKLLFPAASINTGINGLNGLDVGTVAVNTWYSTWFVFNANTATFGGLISTSETDPVLPAGFTYKARVGWIKTGQSSTNLRRLVQFNDFAQYTVTAGSQTPNFPVAATGATAGVIDVSNFIPSTASQVDLILAGANGGGPIEDAVASNGGTAGLSVTNPAPAGYRIDNIPNAGIANIQMSVRLLLDSGTRAVVRFPGGAGVGNTALFVKGWVDNL